MVVVASGHAARPADGLDVGALYADRAGDVRRLVRHDVRAPQPVIEDACQVAWTRLLPRASGVPPERAFAWLVTTAVREAFRMCRRELREASLEELADAGEDLGAYEDPTDARLLLGDLARLPDRQQRLMWLQAAGFSYDEMADRTGISHRTVDRQLLRARRRLRALAGGEAEAGSP